MSTPAIQLLGTGTAFHTDGRGSQCILVRPERAPAFLIDAGPTALAAAARFGVDTDDLDGLFVTHLHGDHTAGWPFLMLQLQFGDARTRPFDVHGPTGVRACLEGLTRLCYGDVLAPEQLAFPIRFHELDAAEAHGLEWGRTRFDVFAMDHHPGSIGFRFTTGAKTVGVSGDTRWCEGLERLGRASDLLVVECTTVAEDALAHLSLDRIRSGIERLGDCELLLVHLTDEVAVSLAADPIARVTAGHDGLIVPL